MFEMVLSTMYKGVVEPPKGQIMYSSAVYATNFVVPKLVTELSIVVIGGGGGYKGWKGGDGTLAYAVNVPVTPGEILKVTVGSGGPSWSNSGDGSSSYVERSGTLLAYGRGGGNGTSSNVITGGAHALVPGGKLYGVGGGSPNAAGSLTGGTGAVRIIWGPGRPTPPYNAPDV